MDNFQRFDGDGLTKQYSYSNLRRNEGGISHNANSKSGERRKYQPGNRTPSNRQQPFEQSSAQEGKTRPDVLDWNYGRAKDPRCPVPKRSNKVPCIKIDKSNLEGK